MGVFDQGARYLAKRNPVGFFRWRIARFLGNFRFVGWLDTSRIAFPGEPDRICDTVAEFIPVDGSEPRRIMDVEFSAEPEGDMLERLGEYAFRLRRELRYGRGQDGKYVVVTMLINMTGAQQADTLDMRETDLDGSGIYLKTDLATLREEDAARTMARIDRGELDRCVLPWIVLMHGAGEVVNIEEWKRLAGAEPDSRLRSDYGGLALVFAELVGNAALWRRALEGWNVRQSQQVLEWQEMARKEADIGRLRADLQRALRLRFRVEIPKDLTAEIEEMTELDDLMRWFDASQTADSFDAFRSAVQQA